MFKNRSFSFWFYLVLLLVMAFFIVFGQTLSIFNYEYVVTFKLQESAEFITDMGMHINRGVAGADTVLYLPLILISVLGIILKKNWSIILLGGVFAITSYWTSMDVFWRFFLKDIPGYTYVPEMDYWIAVGGFFIIGLFSLIHICLRGKKVIE